MIANRRSRGVKPVRRAGVTALTIVVAGWTAAPALAGWRASNATKASIAYNQGIAFDQADGNFFLDGVSSTTNSGLYRTDGNLVQTGSNTAVLPPTREGYNHAGDLSFDPVGRRVLLPLECYYPASGGNTCGVGAIAVADPASLRFQYYVNLDTTQIQKAMWAEISPDGRWIWTSSGTHLLVYRAADVNQTTAGRQRGGTLGGIAGKDFGAVLPTSGVTGAAFYQDVFTRVPRLLLALNRGTYSQVISYPTGTARDGFPTLLGSPSSEIVVGQSSSDHESEGLAVTSAGLGRNPLGGVLDWQMLPVITASSLYSRILSYLPAPAPPRDGAKVKGALTAPAPTSCRPRSSAERAEVSGAWIQNVTQVQARTTRYTGRESCFREWRSRGRCALTGRLCVSGESPGVNHSLGATRCARSSGNLPPGRFRDCGMVADAISSNRARPRASSDVPRRTR